MMLLLMVALLSMGVIWMHICREACTRSFYHCLLKNDKNQESIGKSKDGYFGVKLHKNRFYINYIQQRAL
jgi:hypothetical protein